MDKLLWNNYLWLSILEHISTESRLFLSALLHGNAAINKVENNVSYLSDTNNSGNYRKEIHKQRARATSH